MSHDDDHPDALEDRGRLVMYGGDPYEDDVERDSPSSTSLNAMPARGDMGK